LNDPLNITGYSQVLKQTETDLVTGEQANITYIIGRNRISQITLKDSTEQELYFTFDGHGSTRVLTDLAGAIVELYAFDAYGNAIGFTPSVALTEFLYSGEQFDSKIGQQYLRARYYDPATGRFNRFDPFFGNLNDPQSLHKYLYTHADPVNGIDPSGNMSIGMAISIAVNVGKVAATGAAIGVGINVIRNIALGNAWHQEIVSAAISGAIFLPVIMVCPPVGFFLATVGIVDTINIWKSIGSNPNRSNSQISAAAFYTLFSILFYFQQGRRIFGPQQSRNGVYVNMLLRPGDNGRPFVDKTGFEVLVYGQSSSSSKTPLHLETIDSITTWLVNTTKIATIFKQKSVRTALMDEGRTTWLEGEILPENLVFLRSIPDIITISKNGKVYLFEVRSKTDKISDLRTKLKNIFDQIPQEQQGGYEVIEPGNLPTIPINE
jgi:RHS repeat-associated protein